MIYDGIELEDHFRINYEWPLALPTRTKTKEIPGRPGLLLMSVDFDPLVIPVTFRMKNKPMDDMAEFRRFYRTLLFRSKPKAMHFPEDSGGYRLGIFQNVNNLDTLWYTGVGTCNFVANDPIAYGEEHVIQAEGTRFQFQYFGTYKAAPVFEAWPKSGSSFTVTDYLTGEFVTVDAQFNGSQHVVIDCGRQQTTINGENHKVVHESLYPSLIPGENCEPREMDVRCSHDGVTMRWQDRWL